MHALQASTLHTHTVNMSVSEVHASPAMCRPWLQSAATLYFIEMRFSGFANRVAERKEILPTVSLLILLCAA